MCSIEDAEPWSVFWSSHPIARKEHICGDCGRRIAQGERYYSARGRFDDCFIQNKMCAHCEAAAEWLVEVCHGYLFTGVLDELVEHFEENDPPIRSIALGRLIARMRRKWRDRAGNLVEVPTWARELGHDTFMALREIELIDKFERQIRKAAVA